MHRKGNVCSCVLICLKININGVKQSYLFFFQKSLRENTKIIFSFLFLEFAVQSIAYVPQKYHFYTKFYTSASKLSQWYKNKAATNLWVAEFACGRNFSILNVASRLTQLWKTICPVLFSHEKRSPTVILPHCMALWKRLSMCVLVQSCEMIYIDGTYDGTYICNHFAYIIVPHHSWMPSTVSLKWMCLMPKFYFAMAASGRIIFGFACHNK